MISSKNSYLKNLMDYINNYKVSAIYGAGTVGVGLYKDLKKLGVCIQFFIVTSSVGQRTEIDGIPVLQIDQVPNLEEVGIIVGVSLGKISGVKKKLSQYKITNYIILSQEYIATILREFNVPKMEITTIIGCTVNCKYCPQKLLITQYWKYDKNRPKVMSLQTFKNCLNKLPKYTQIYFAGMSEAFLNKECIKMIKYSLEMGYHVGVYTTCVGLSLSDCMQLIEMPIDSLILHVPDENNYAHIQMTSEYWKIIETLLNAKKKDGSLFVDSGSCQGTPLKKFMELNRGRIRIESYLHDRAGNLPADNMKLESCDYVGGEIYCYHSMERLDHNILLPDGTVLLCCMDYGMRHTIGNLNDNSYEEIINGNILNDIRMALKDEKKNLLCRKCTYAIEYKSIDGCLLK